MELHILAELEDVFLRKWLPRYLATVDDEHLRRALERVCEESEMTHHAAQEAIATWVAQRQGAVMLTRSQAMDLSRHAFVDNLALFKAACAATLVRAAQAAPSPGVAKELLRCAEVESRHSEELQTFVE